jgi:predicted nucleotidyltransferase
MYRDRQGHSNIEATRTFIRMVGLENRLADILEVRVDLTPARALKERIRERVTREAVLAFWRY